jgi:hypothetical protein
MQTKRGVISKKAMFGGKDCEPDEYRTCNTEYCPVSYYDPYGASGGLGGSLQAEQHQAEQPGGGLMQPMHSSEVMNAAAVRETGRPSGLGAGAKAGVGVGAAVLAVAAVALAAVLVKRGRSKSGASSEQPGLIAGMEQSMATTPAGTHMELDCDHTISVAHL